MREDEKVDPVEARLEAQQDLANLQRQYRCMRNGKKTFTEESENIIRRQMAAIKTLVTENKDLVSLNKVAGRLWNQCFDENNLEQINNLMNRETQIKMEMELQRNESSNVEDLVCEIEIQINEQRKMMRGSKDVSHHKYIIVTKKIRVLKNRLDNMNKKFNIAMADNRKLRESIHHVLGQKARFRHLYERLQQKLNEDKAEIQRISDIATLYFNARDEAQHRMASLRERGERDLALYNLEIKDVMRIIDHDRKLREFMNTKAEDRASILVDELKSRELQKISLHLGGLKNEVSKYEDIFTKIKEATGIQETDTLVSSFIENEDKNFALYNYVNAMSTELESLQEDIKFLREEIEQTKKEGVENDVRRKEILQDLEAKQKRSTARLNTLNKMYTRERRILELAKPRIEKVFNGIKCDRNVISEMLGGGVTVDDYNVLLYLGIIEQKCNELLQRKAMNQIKTAGEDQKDVTFDSLQGAGPRPAHANLSITPPSIAEESDYLIQASDAKPLTVDEVQALISQVVVRGGTAKGAGVTGAQRQGSKKRRLFKATF